jgi:hypothetical protein
MGIGADLKKAREELGITLQAVSEKTKINIPFLESIEREEWSVFPSQTFAKGFLRAYAKMVKVDTVLATRQFNEEVMPTSVVVSPPFNIESGPIQTSLFPTSVKKEPLVVHPTSTPVPMSTPMASMESRPATLSRPAVPPRTTSIPRVALKPAFRDLALEFDDAAAAEERQAVARMLFTRRTSPTMDFRRWWTMAANAIALLIFVALLAFGARGLWHWAKGLRHHTDSAAVDSPMSVAVTEAPAPMEPVDSSDPIPPTRPIAPRALGSASKTKPIVRVGVPKPIAKPIRSTLDKSQGATAPMGGAPQTGVAAPGAAQAASSVAPVSMTSAQAAAQAAAPVDKYHHLILKGLESAWVLVVVDGRVRSQMNIQPGQLKAFQAVHGFAVKIGNAAGVDAQYDGRSLGVLGGHGRVVEFVLPQGYQPPIEP